MPSGEWAYKTVTLHKMNLHSYKVSYSCVAIQSVMMVSFSILCGHLSVCLSVSPFGQSRPLCEDDARYKTRMQNSDVQSIEDECVCAFFLCLYVLCVCVCVTQPLPGISDGKTVRLQWTSSKDVNPNNQPHTLSPSRTSSSSLKQINGHKQASANTHTHRVTRSW